MSQSTRKNESRKHLSMFETLENRRLLSGGTEPEHPQLEGLHEGMLIVRGSDARLRTSPSGL